MSDPRFDIAQLGLRAQELKEHPAMQALLERLQRNAETARELLTEHPAQDEMGIRTLQQEVAMFKRLVAMIDAMILEGRYCEEDLNDEDAVN